MKISLFVFCFIQLSICFSQSIGRSSINALGSNSSKGNIQLNQSVGQSSNITLGNSEKTYLRQGFQQPIYFIEESNELNVSVYPNPTNSVFYFTIQNSDISEGNYTVTDLNGKIIFQNRTNSQEKNKVDLLNESSGMYLLSIQAGSKKSIFKINLIK